MKLGITIDRAARRAGVDRRTINRWITDGRLTVATLDGVRYVYLPELLRCERERRNSRNLGRPRELPFEERFWRRVAGSQVAECWEWQGHRLVNGYGQCRGNDGNRILAHRLAYEMLRAEIPQGLDLDHLCHNRACVNPWHLEPVTASANTQRRSVLAYTEKVCTICNFAFRPSGPNTKRCARCRSVAFA